MKHYSKQVFLSWASTKRLGLDSKYPRSAVLSFQFESDSRFWNVPAKPKLRPYFLASLIELLGDFQSCYVWRHLGRWPDSNCLHAGRINDAVELLILRGIGVPLGTELILEFTASELEALITLLFSTTIFGSTVSEDVYVVPDHGRQIIQIDHHDVVHVSFADKPDVNHWVSKMSEAGFDLPDDLPDATFKAPDWLED